MSTSIVYPLQLIRARLFQNDKNTKQNKYKNVSHCVQLILKNEGISGFYKGLPMGLLKTVPGSALTFMFYENIKWFLCNQY